jgi:hypothetical protein
MPDLLPGDTNLNLAQSYPTTHLLQLPEWAELKSHFGWQSQVFNTQTATAQVLFRSLPLGFTIAYLPKGPVGNNWSSLWPHIDQNAANESLFSCRLSQIFLFRLQSK